MQVLSLAVPGTLKTDLGPNAHSQEGIYISFGTGKFTGDVVGVNEFQFNEIDNAPLRVP